MEVVATGIQDDASRSLGYCPCIKQDHVIVYADTFLCRTATIPNTLRSFCFAVQWTWDSLERINRAEATKCQPAIDCLFECLLFLTLEDPSSLLTYTGPTLRLPMHPHPFEYLETGAM
jgi:hypothetical protein